MERERTTVDIDSSLMRAVNLAKAEREIKTIGQAFDEALRLWVDKRATAKTGEEKNSQLNKSEALRNPGTGDYNSESPMRLGKHLVRLLERVGANAVERLAEGVLRMEDEARDYRDTSQQPKGVPYPELPKQLKQQRLNRADERVSRESRRDRGNAG